MLAFALAAVSISKLTLIPLLPGYTETQICGLTADGQTVIGYQFEDEKKVAFRWDQKSGVKNLGGVSWNMWRAGMPTLEFDEHGNPIDVVGLKQNQIRWARTVALMNTPKADLKPFKTPWIFGSSADGKVCFGNGTSKDGQEGFVWTKATGAVGIGDLPGGFFYSQAVGICPEGKWAVGCSKSFDGLTAAVWSKSTGIAALRYKGQDKAFSRAVCVSLNAKTIGGETLASGGVEAIVWLSMSQGVLVRSLKGFEGVPGWTLSSVECVSDDGTVISGMATEVAKPDDSRSKEKKAPKIRAWIANIVSR